MKKIRYTGASGVREITKEDLASVDIKSSKDIRIRGRNLRTGDPELLKLPEVIEVSNDVADWLIENEEFEEATGPKAADKEEATASVSASASAEGEPDELPLAKGSETRAARP